MNLDTFLGTHTTWREPETGYMTGGAVIEAAFANIRERYAQEIPIPLDQDPVCFKIGRYSDFGPGERTQYWKYAKTEMVFVSSSYLVVLGRGMGEGGIDAVVELRLVYRDPHSGLFFDKENKLVSVDMALADNYGLRQAEVFADYNGKLGINEDVRVGRTKWKNIHADRTLYTGHRPVTVENVRMNLHLYTPAMVDWLVKSTQYGRWKALA